MSEERKQDSWCWVCNECGSRELTSSVSESDLRWFACSECGCNEFHKEPEPADRIEE